MANNTGKKYGGRSAGTKNKVTNDLKALIYEFLNFEWESIKDDFRSLQAKDRLVFYDKMLSYCIPKNKEVEESEPFAEQPLFLNVNNFKLDDKTIQAIPYSDLKKLITDSEAFMTSKKGLEYTLSLAVPLDLNVKEQGEKTPTFILNLGCGLKPED